MQKIFSNIIKFCTKPQTPFLILCLGILSQLLTGKPILGWDILSHITKLTTSLGSSGFTGVVVTLLLYMIFIKDETTRTIKRN